MKSISSNPGSYAILSGRDDAAAAVFFVHGFNGNALSTWHDFQSLIDDDPEREHIWATSDLYFYGYPSTSANVAVESSRFTQFLNRFFPVPKRTILSDPSEKVKMRSLLDLSEELSFPLTERYDSLILVGHSLGGVIIRQALADAAVSYDASVNTKATGSVGISDILRAEVRLFAPAIFGFEPSHLPGFFYNLVLESPTLGRFLKPVLKSNPVHSEIGARAQRLVELRRRTEELARKHPSMRAMHAHLLFGTKESVVYIDRYDCDPVLRIEEAYDHTSICKPNQHNRLPLEFVAHEISTSISAR